MNRLEIRNLALYWLDDLLAGYFTEPQMNAFIANAEYETQKKLVQAYENYYLKCVETTTVANQSDYVLPEDFLKLSRIEVVLSGTGQNENRVRLIPITLNQTDRYSEEPAPPECYVMKKDRVTLYPTPDNTYTLRLYYQYRLVPMSADVDQPDVPLEYHEYIAILAAFDGFVKDDRAPQNLVEKKEAYEALFKQMAEDRTIDQPRHVLSSDGDFGLGSDGIGSFF